MSRPEEELSRKKSKSQLILSNWDYMRPEKSNMKSRHHLEGATYNRGWKEEIRCNKELSRRPEEVK